MLLSSVRDGALVAEARTVMNYSTAISKRRRAKKLEYLARLVYRDATTGKRKERSKSASSLSEAKRILKELEDEFRAGGQTAVESHEMTFPDLVKHCRRHDTVKLSSTMKVARSWV